MTSWLLVALLAMDLAAVKQEPNLEHRSDLALDNADAAVTACGEAYRNGDLEKTKAEAAEVEESVTIALDSLNETGKDARRHPKYFKRAELATRHLLRRLDGLIESMSSADRPLLLFARDRISDIHDELLGDMMRKKKN
jgi:hypothetical protein